ncbi:sulfurtransferase-like selenium metabolism protein YedF [uncultured Helicobacter sp.]|uniref:sulfurtransferase-like selenium metabolism protein YedF n=1 Tax=uncultured Helicobacter sp. TaxID=175537 RepID=UPI00260F345A|nr:sulfurtransferase-like selenium metabolism protein YedF [uncultured Helicobacter sp.]
MSKVLLLKDDKIGEHAELGRKLMLNFLGTLLTMDKQPKAMYLLNRAVLLATTDSEGVEALKRLEEKGVVIYSCQTCLGHFNVLDMLKVGSIGNMQNTLNALLSEDSVITI